MNGNEIIIGSTQKHSAISTNGIVPTLTSAMGQGGGHVPMHNYDLRIRKLTPKECWRLMGFDDEDFYSAKYGCKIDKEIASKISNSLITKMKFELANRKTKMSNTQLYKQAGNSIVVNVLAAILKQLL